jgi:calcium/calmodulin-dependent protein kinase I
MAESSQTCLGYTLKEKLGYGAFSFARKGINSKGQEAALKFTKYSKGSEGSKKRQRTEIQTELSVFKNIKHPNVMQMYEFTDSFMYKHDKGEPSECYVMALELASGGELFDLIYYTGALDEKLSRTFFKQIVDGIEAMHLQSLAHRDIKPQNVLLTSDFQIKIADFGSSKRFRSDQLMKTSRVGTRGYQAPELLLQRGYTTKCDIFSLGVLLFVSLTKHPPFKQAIQEDPWFRQIAKKDYKNFWRKHPKDKLSPKCCDLIVRMLCYQPLDRFTIQQTKQHPWLAQEVYSKSELASVLASRMKKAASARGADGVRAPENFNSIAARSTSEVIPPPTINAIQKLYAIETHAHPWGVISWIQNELEVQQGLCKVEMDEAGVTAMLTTQITEEVKGMKNMHKKGQPDYKTDQTFVTNIKIQVKGYCENWNQENEAAEKYYIEVKVVDGMAVYMADETSSDQLDFYETVMNVMKLGIQEVEGAEEEEVAAAN